MTTSRRRWACTSYTLYMQDYGGPVGFRLALAHPERIRSLVCRTPSRTTKLGEIWRLPGFWADRPAYEARSANEPPVPRNDPDPSRG